MNKSKSLITFIYRYNKVTLNVGYSGFYTDDITLTKDLVQYLTDKGIYGICTTVVTVLTANNEIYPIRVLKDYIPLSLL